MISVAHGLPGKAPALHAFSYWNPTVSFNCVCPPRIYHAEQRIGDRDVEFEPCYNAEPQNRLGMQVSEL